MPRYRKRSSGYSDLIELDVIRAGRPSRAPGRPRGQFLSRKEREKYRNKNLCFKCKRPRHRAKECRSGPPDRLHIIIAGLVEQKADTTKEDLVTDSQGEET